MAKVIIKPWVKALPVILVIAAVVVGVIFGVKSCKEYAKDKKKSSVVDENTIVIGTNTYAGFLPFMYLNGGLEPSDSSVIFKEYGIKLKIVIQDDFSAGRAAFRKGDIDVIYATCDSWPVETGDGSDMTDSRFFNVSNFSRGSDAIVVSEGIRSISDLIGKSIACSEGTASHTLLLNMLETNEITPNMINTSKENLDDKVNIRVVANGLDAAQAFKSGAVDAAVVFSPDDQDIVKTVPGAKVLISTKQASNIICDGLVAKSLYIKNNADKLAKLVSALMYANEKMNNDPEAVKVAAKAFAKAYGTDEEFAIAGSKNVYYTTLGDQVNFFGLNPEYKGVTGRDIYGKMAKIYSQLRLTNNPLPWEDVSTTSIIDMLRDNPDQVKGNQTAESTAKFDVATGEMTSAAAISDKQISIEYALGSYDLDNEARSQIDVGFVDIAKQFGNARIRIVGNTDNTGDYDKNMQLSFKRAQSVVDYLVTEYGFDRNRFMVIGNGPKRAIRDNIVGPNKKYRTTDFQLVVAE